MAYIPQKIELRWQKFWENNSFYKAEDFSKKPKQYLLIEFPYPSGSGLHVGHLKGYVGLDIVSRKKRMEGFNVLFPIGWDAFGLPTENFALKTGIHPKVATEKNISNYKKQIKSLGLSFDWLREINTTDPKYYKWTQWIFRKLFEKGLAYQAEMPINWCPSCKIGLANEEVVEGKCERCGEMAGKKVLKQWMIRITKYADRLIDDLEKVDYLEKIKSQQINWIGRSLGTEVDFKIVDSKETIKVFTTRVDTLFGTTAVVLAPENMLVEKLITKENKKEVEKYIKEAKSKSDFDRENLEKEKTGVFTGSYCINPANNKKIPIWVGDYVIAAYGGGAVMTVPAHDYRDYDFAKKYGLEIREVVSGGNISKPSTRVKLGAGPVPRRNKVSGAGEAFIDYGTLVNSGEFNGLKSEDAIKKITQWLEKKGLGREAIRYKLRDWVFSRQHYWGEPIPIIHCQKCGPVAVPEKDLPVELPYIEKYQPTGTGKSPLAAIKEWVNVKCPKCGGPAKRETDTMPNWAGSNWYFMRYTDPNNDKALADSKKLKYWLPVDWYNGGMEHTTLHLLYSRFIYKFLFDIGVASEPEPYKRRTSHGIILAEDGRKMSKSFGNVVNPDEIVEKYGADTLRVYEMFMGPFDQAIAWSEDGVRGVFRFMCRLWDFVVSRQKTESSRRAQREINKLNKKIGEDIEKMKFNTAVAAVMEFLNFAIANPTEIGQDVIEKLLILIFPFAPHLSEELWQKTGKKDFLSQQSWPSYDSNLIREEKITLVVQINGRVRGKIEVGAEISETEAKELAISQNNVIRWLEGKKIKKVIFVPNKLINIVV